MTRTPCRLRARIVGGAILIGLVGSAAWAGWPFGKRTIDPERFAGGPIRMMVYRGGKPIADRTYPEDSPAAEAVRRWLANHAQDWYPDLNTYVPGRYFTGEKFMLNFWGNYAILDYELKGSPQRWSEVYRRVIPGDVPELFGPPRPR